MYTKKQPSHRPRHVGIRQFRQRLADFLLEGNEPIAITRHGDTVGFYVPARRRADEADRSALAEAARRLDAMLKAKGITEDEIVEDFKQWRAKRQK